MYSKFNEETRKILLESKNESDKLKHRYIGSEHLVLAMLKSTNNVNKILTKHGLTYESFKKEIIKTIGIGDEVSEWFLYTPLFKKIIESAMIECREKNIDVSSEALLFALLDEGEGVAIRIMAALDINVDELYNELRNNNKGNKVKGNKRLHIEEFGYNMNEKANSNTLDPVIERDEEIQRVIEILCRRTKNNPLLIGEAGVGKSAIVEGLCTKIVNKNVPDKLKNKKIYSISMASLVAGTKYRGEFEERINKLLKELESHDDVILFLDEIHTLVGAGGAEGAIDASNILKPVLARGKIKIIGATTNEEYKKYIEQDRALDRRFQTVFIEEPDLSKTKRILYKLRPIYEKYHSVVIPDETIDAILQYSDQYIYNRKFPDKAIDIMDEAAVKASMIVNKQEKQIIDMYKQRQDYVNQIKDLVSSQRYNDAISLRKKEKELETKINKLELKKSEKRTPITVTCDAVKQIITSKTKIPIYDLKDSKKNEIDINRKKISGQVIGQEQAVDKVCNAFKRILYGYKDDDKPDSFLFTGPTGVGKTCLAKTISNIFFGQGKLIYLDMSEYKEEHSISKIIGSPPGYVGYEDKKTVLEQVKDSPYTVILLDEIEKAHKSVINLFLQVLDEGRLKKSSGEEIKFNHTIIIMTSNSQNSGKKVGFLKDGESDNNYIKEKLGLEIINRIDNIIAFNQLTEKDIHTIIQNKLEKLKEKFIKNNINIKLSKRCIDEIILASEYKIYGARRIDKILKDKVDNIIIDKIIEGCTDINIQTIK